MNPAAVAHPDPGKWPSLALAALVHVALLLFLFFGVRWQNPAPEAVEVSVVDSLPPPPRASAPEPAPRPEPKPEPRPEPPRPEPKPEPKPVPKAEPKPPPPPPAKPDIVTRPEPPKKPEPPKPEPRPEPKPEPKRAPRPEPKPPAKPVQEKPEPDRMKELLAQEDRQRRAEEQKRQAAENQRLLSEQLAADSRAQAQSAAKASAAKASALEGYINKIRVKVRGNIILPPGVSGKPEAVFLVDQASDGLVLDVRLKKSSGNPALDAAIEKAIHKSSPLPKPDNPELFSRSLELTFRPLED